jgi:hypothetical protein
MAIYNQEGFGRDHLYQRSLPKYSAFILGNLIIAILLRAAIQLSHHLKSHKAKSQWRGGGE